MERNCGGRVVTAKEGAMAINTQDHLEHSAILARALRLVRQHRHMSAKSVAEKIGVPLSSYERWENGKSRLSYDRIVRFATATDSDPVALVTCVMLSDPVFAVRCADNKLMITVAIALRELNDALGDDLDQLGPALPLAAFRQAVRAIIDKVHRADPFANSWARQRMADPGAVPVKRHRRRARYGMLRPSDAG